MEMMVDFEREAGTWIRAIAFFEDLEATEDGIPVRLHSITAFLDGGALAALSDEEFANLRDRFERAYYRWRSRAAIQPADPHRARR